MIQPQPVRQENPEIILDENFANNRVAKMRELGAKNAAPPLAPSTHLINKQTGVIFPWSPALAEMRDVLVNCDENGNTDPAAWKKNVLSEQQIAEQSDLMTQAYGAIIRPAAFMQKPPAQVNASEQTLASEPPAEETVAPESAQTLEQLSQMID